MSAAPLPTHFMGELNFADVLTDPQTDRVFGYCIGGERPGPNALFGTWSPTVAEVAQRLIQLPSLPWMWGSLYLVALDLLQDQQRDVKQCLPNVAFDKVSILDEPEMVLLDSQSFDDSYWAVLRMCTGLGMIQGRGVSPKSEKTLKATALDQFQKSKFP
jgi:hypothetical protein